MTESDVRELPFSYPDGAATTANNQAAKVALVCMPFAALQWPHLGISLLKALLARQGIACDIHYLNIPFARQIGLPTYVWVHTKPSSRQQLGEWLFAQALFGDTWDTEHLLLDNLEDGPGRINIPPEYLERSLRNTRGGVREYLDTCLSLVTWEQYTIIGFSSTFEQNIASLALARRIKTTWPEKVIVFGGANCEGEMGLELHHQFPFVDYVCRGESDLLFPTLVEHLLADAPPPHLPGLILRDENGQSIPVGTIAQPVTDLDNLPYPDFDDYFRQVNGNVDSIPDWLSLPFETSRGCWYGEKQRCTFCGINGEMITFRSKSPGRVFEEMTYLTRRYGVSELYATDSILDLSYLSNLLPMLIKRGDNWTISCDVRANLRRDQLLVLKRAGISRLGVGIESLSSSVLKLMRKGCTAMQNVQLLKWADELGILVYWNFIWGFPGEDADEYARMSEMIPALIHLQPPVSVSRIRLDRFSTYFNDPECMGVVNVRPTAGYRAAYALPEESLQRLAYFFDFDYADGRDPDTYTACLAEMIRYWQANYCPGALRSITYDQALVITDRRPEAKQAGSELTGWEKATYEYCDEARALRSIHGHLADLGYAVSKGTLYGQLEGWVEDKLMLCEGDWFLSLAVPADGLVEPVSGSNVIRQALVEASAELVVDASWRGRLKNGTATNTAQ